MTGNISQIFSSEARDFHHLLSEQCSYTFSAGFPSLLNAHGISLDGGVARILGIFKVFDELAKWADAEARQVPEAF